MDPLSIGAGFMSGEGASFVPKGGSSSSTGTFGGGDFGPSYINIATGNSKVSAANGDPSSLVGVPGSIPWPMLIIGVVVAVAVWKLA